MADNAPEYDIKILNQYVRDARFAHAEWQQEAWIDCEFRDGVQWSIEDQDKANAANVEMLTINRIFPVINLALGSYENNPVDITAKARTQDDGEIAQVMTEGIKFVMDQNEGEFKISNAFFNALTPGIGLLELGLNSDPRKEQLKISGRDWKNFMWDPFGDPWLDPTACRYCFYQPWIDVADLRELFPGKKKEIEEKFDSLSGMSPTHMESGDMYSIMNDVSLNAEEYVRQMIGTGWADKTRLRCRPVEMWWSKFKECIFARFENDMVLEIRDDMPAEQQYQMLLQAKEIIKTKVRKICTTTFLGDLVLQNQWSPYNHDLYPYVPFFGFLDRYNFPFGMPRMIRGQNIEVNKRRSMALALLGKKRVILESDPKLTPSATQNLYNEAQKPDGFLVLNPDPGKPIGNRILIEDQSQVSQFELGLMSQSENEIQQISGANAPMMGYQSNATSGVAKRQDIQQGSTIMAPVFGNLRRSLFMLGTRVVSGIQQYWTGPKVLRVTDRISGAEKFVEINKRMQLADGTVLISNNVTQGRYDTVVSERPATDTVREANLALLQESIQKATPEMVPILIEAAFEISDLPNKEKLLERIRSILGSDPFAEDMSAAERKQKVMAELEAQAQKRAEMDQAQAMEIQAKLEEMALNNEKLKAEIDKIKAETSKALSDARVKADDVSLKGFQTGAKLAQDAAGRRVNA